MGPLWFRSALIAAARRPCDDAVTPATDAVGAEPLADAGVQADDAGPPEADAVEDARAADVNPRS